MLSSLRPHLLLLVSAIFAVGAVDGYQTFQSRIPNGALVTNPCSRTADALWEGVGHMASTGGGTRNPFGQDFDIHGEVWSETLCKTDSDGDGRTNGEELGDDACTWTPGSIPPRTGNITHPGICEPLDSDKCRQLNFWLHCNNASLQDYCPEILHPDTKNMTVKLSRSQVPTIRTVYTCQMIPLELPDGEDYHVIAAEPLIDKTEVVHHINLYGCSRGKAAQYREELSQPTSCLEKEGGVYYCDEILYVWSLGVSPECLDGDYGIRLGNTGYSTLILEVHWENVDGRSDLYDETGLRLYYSPRLRGYNSFVFYTMTPYLELAPQHPHLLGEGGCSSQCTRRYFSETVYMPKAFPHMHIIGRGMKFVHFRDGREIAVLFDVRDFTYRAPQWIEYDPPVEIHPGDELRVTCTFDTTHRHNYTYYGDATFDEMCIVMSTFYARQNTGIGDTRCATLNDVGFCKTDEAGTRNDPIFRACFYDWYTIGNLPNFMVHYNRLEEVCDTKGLQCNPQCEEVAFQFRSKHPCFHAKIEHFTRAALHRLFRAPAFNFTQMLSSCPYNLTRALIETETMGAKGDLNKVDIVNGASLKDTCNLIALVWLYIMLLFRD